MNRIFFFFHELPATVGMDKASLCRICVTDRRADHLQRVLEVGVGDVLKVGVVDGLLGTGEVTRVSRGEVDLDLRFDTSPSPSPDIQLIVALPRPQMVKRVVTLAATFGVRTVFFIRSANVDKSYFQSSALSDESILKAAILGLEQGNCYTRIPEVRVVDRFQRFLFDVLPEARGTDSKCFLADGNATTDFRSAEYALGRSDLAVVAIGPERGFSEYEEEQFLNVGFLPVRLGEPTLRVDDAVCSVLAQISLVQKR